MSRGGGWTTTADIQAELTRRWERGLLLSTELGGASLFPLRLPVRAPGPQELLTRFDDARRWIRALEEGSRAIRGYGYELEWLERNHRQLGRNRVPCGVVVPTVGDALRLIGRGDDARRFHALVEATLAAFPDLHPWLVEHPLRALEHAGDWARLLAVLDWFRRHPRPGLYLRQLDIPGVDTKFIETRRGLLAELLDRVLPPEAIDETATGAAGFERRYGLRSKPALVRFRLLDPRQTLAGLSDLSVPAADFARLSPPARQVFITENEVNGLAMPARPDSLVIFGLGYSLERLAEATWLQDREVWYWGDIDTHGFAILNRLRSFLPEACSFLMDRETLLRHRALWDREERRHDGALSRLRPDERALYDELRADTHGEHVRLEQERIAFGWVIEALQGLGPAALR